MLYTTAYKNYMKNKYPQLNNWFLNHLQMGIVSVDCANDASSPLFSLDDIYET